MREAMSPCGILYWKEETFVIWEERDVKLLVISVVGQAKFVAHIKQTPGRIAQPTDGGGGQVGLLTYKKCARGIKLVAIQFAPSLL